MGWTGADVMTPVETLLVETGTMSNGLLLDVAPGDTNASPDPAWLLWWAVSRQQ